MNYEHAAATHPKNNVYGIDPNKFFGDSDDAKSRKKNSSKSKSLSRSRNSGSYSRSPRLLNNNLDRDYNFGDMSGIDYNAENNNQEASIDMIIPADKAMELERLRRNQEMLLERNYQRHVEEEREVRARKYNERPDYNREFKTSTRLDDKARADPKGRIAGSLSRRLQLNQSDRGGGKGNMNIYRPRTLGMNAQFEYRNQIFSGRSKFSRNRDQVNQDLQSQSIIPYEMDNNNRLSRNQEIEMNEEIQQIMSQYDYIRAMYVTYYRSFDKYLHYAISFVHGIDQDKMKEGNPELLQASPSEPVDIMKVWQRKIEEETISKQIFQEMEEMQFNSIAYFYRKVPKADLKYLSMQELPGFRQVNQKFQKIFLTNLRETIESFKREKSSSIGEEIEQGITSFDNSYFEKKISNLEEMSETFIELSSTQPKYTFLKFNNDRQFCEQLPIYAKKAAILKALQDGTQVIVLQTSAGSGKSTQLPQYLLEGTNGRAVITEPRAMVVEAVANRVHAVEWRIMIGAVLVHGS